MYRIIQSESSLYTAGSVKIQSIDLKAIFVYSGSTMNSQTLALFDFDGTISTKNSFLEFAAFLYGRSGLYKKSLQLLPLAVRFATRQITDHQFKEAAFAHFCGGMKEEEFHAKATEYGHNLIPNIVRPKAAEKIQEHKRNGDTIIVVSASFQEVLKPWCDLLGVNVIATVLEAKDGVITGKLDSPVCWGPQKVERIRQALDLKYFTKVVAYGNSRGDKEMLAFADDAFYKPF